VAGVEVVTLRTNFSILDFGSAVTVTTVSLEFFVPSS
jgi:hypothetical protein